MHLMRRPCFSYIALIALLGSFSVCPSVTLGKQHSQKPPSNTAIIVEKNLFSQERHYTPMPDKTEENDPWKKRMKREVLVHGIYEINGHPKALLKISRILADKWGINTDSRGFIKVGEGESLGNFTVTDIGRNYILLKGEGKAIKLILADYPRGGPSHISRPPSVYKERKGKKNHRKTNKKRRKAQKRKGASQ